MIRPLSLNLHRSAFVCTQDIRRRPRHRLRAESCSWPIFPHHEYTHYLLEHQRVPLLRNPWPQEDIAQTGAPANFGGTVDVLLLQEHKLSASQTSKCAKVLTGRSHTYWEPSIGKQGRSGGICISISAPLLQHVCGFGTLIPG